MKSKDRILIQKIVGYIDDVEVYVMGIEARDFLADKKTITACAFTVSQIGELAKEITPETQEKYKDIPWKSIKGMRNKIVHDYENVDLSVLWGTIKSSLERPQRVSIGYVERVLGLKEGQLSHLSKCTAYLNNHIVSKEEHWARCIAWAVNRLNRQNKPVHITNIQKLTNIRKKNLLLAIPYLNKYIDTETVDHVVGLLG